VSNEAIDRSKLPIRRPPFQVKVNRTLDGSEPDKALANAVKKSVAQIDGMSAKKLKAGLAEARAGMGG